MWTKLRDPGTGTAAMGSSGRDMTSRPEFSRSRAPALTMASRAGPGGCGCVWTESALTARFTPRKDDASSMPGGSSHLVLQARGREGGSWSSSG